MGITGHTVLQGYVECVLCKTMAKGVVTPSTRAMQQFITNECGLNRIACATLSWDSRALDFLIARSITEKSASHHDVRRAVWSPGKRDFSSL